MLIPTVGINMYNFIWGDLEHPHDIKNCHTATETFLDIEEKAEHKTQNIDNDYIRCKFAVCCTITQRPFAETNPTLCIQTIYIKLECITVITVVVQSFSSATPSD